MPKFEPPEGNPTKLEDLTQDTTSEPAWGDPVELLKHKLPGESHKKVPGQFGDAQVAWGDRAIAAPPDAGAAGPAADIVQIVDQIHDQRRFLETRKGNAYIWQHNKDGTWTREGHGDPTINPKDSGKDTLKVYGLAYDEETGHLTYTTKKDSVPGHQGMGIDASWVQTRDGTRTGTLANGTTIEIKTNPEGEITEVTDANGVRRAFQYDDKHRITSFTETQDGVTVTWTPGKDGRWSSSDGRRTSPPANKGQIEVDEVGNVYFDKKPLFKVT